MVWIFNPSPGRRTLADSLQHSYTIRVDLSSTLATLLASESRSWTTRVASSGGQAFRELQPVNGLITRLGHDLPLPPPGMSLRHNRARPGVPSPRGGARVRLSRCGEA